MRDEPASTREDERPVSEDDRATSDDDRPMHEPTSDYEQGRADEAREREGRFARAPESERERADDPTRSGPA